MTRRPPRAPAGDPPPDLPPEGGRSQRFRVSGASPTSPSTGPGARSPHLLSPLEGGPGGMTRRPPTDCAPARDPPPDLPPERGEEPESQGVGYLADIAVAGPGACSPHLLSPLEGGPGGITPPPTDRAPPARGTPLPTSPLKGGRRENGGRGPSRAPTPPGRGETGRGTTHRRPTTDHHPLSTPARKAPRPRPADHLLMAAIDAAVTASLLRWSVASTRNSRRSNGAGSRGTTMVLPGGRFAGS